MSLQEIHQARVRNVAVADPSVHHDYLASELTGAPVLRWPPAQTRRGAGPVDQVEAILDPQYMAEVDALAARAGVTRFTVLMARCGRALAEVTGQSDLTVGVPVAQRDIPGLDRVIGCHLTMVCLRLRGAAIGEGLDAIRATARVVDGAMAARDVPFEDLVRLAGSPRSVRPPLFQAVVALQDNEPPGLALTGLRTTFVRQPYVDLPVDLHIELWPEENGGVRLTVPYRPAAVPLVVAHDLVKRLAGAAPAPPGGGDQ
jgi:hypothetical protein